MKKFLSLVLLSILSLSLTGCLDEVPTAPVTTDQKASADSAKAAKTSIPVPTVSYFQERRTIAKWAERWDKPSVPTYVYLVSFGQILGYYVCDGKPASTRSYILPEESIVNDPHGSMDAGSLVMQAPDIDGTYGDNAEGLRGFTASGVAFEWAGSGASWLYSDAPLSLSVPCFGK